MPTQTHGRIRQRGVVASQSTRLALADEITMLERDGKKLYREGIIKPVTVTPNSGEQLSGKLKAALAILDRALKLRLQLDRLGGAPDEARREQDNDPVKSYQAAKPKRPA